GHQDHTPGCRAVTRAPTGVRVVPVTPEWPTDAAGPDALAEPAGAGPAVSIARPHLNPPPPKLPLFLALHVLRI
ncbi:MAG: hypothetical protein K2X87_02855, partial [Gemmataceae bacterium]|nr:hypothetical protein [Gemmataceae bacterium]